MALSTFSGAAVLVTRIESEAQLHVESGASQEPEQGDAPGQAAGPNELARDAGRDRHQTLQPLDLRRGRAACRRAPRAGQERGDAGQWEAHQQRHGGREHAYPRQQEELTWALELPQSSHPAT